MIPWAKPTFLGREKELLLDALDSGWISGGPYVERLEKGMAERLGSPHALAVSNGTAALHLALLGLGIGPGDEVIVPGFTFVAAVNMVLAVGATPVYADIDPATWLLDPVSAATKITPRTKAIIAVHLYGNIADMKGLAKLAQDRGLALIEDAAEACFSTWEGRCAGTIGTVGTLSFHATKTMTTGEGGMVLAADPELAQRMFSIREHGMRARKRYWHDVVGHNFRLTNLQAALGCAQLERIDTIIRERGRVHAAYKRRLADGPRFRLQHFESCVDPVLWTFCVQLREQTSADARDRVLERLTTSGIEVRPGFVAVGEMPIYATLPLPRSLEAARSVIALPTYPDLSDAEIDFICDAFLKALET
ncbi:MAG: DegT/DnrJ/EryC1/StrS family aminotransferase [Rhodospirillales bacterium]|nr:DegT/DnrJ/EryC1/StrS family aminotransferase [Rhodospirillales bacterium]